MNDVFKAIADPTRREILLTLVKGAENVNSISTKFNMSRPAVSKHLKILADIDLIRMERDQTDSRQRKCFVQLEALQEVSQFLNQLEKFWNSKLDGLDNYLKSHDQE